jgi:hypothetical protein
MLSTRSVCHRWTGSESQQKNEIILYYIAFVVLSWPDLIELEFLGDFLGIYGTELRRTFYFCCNNLLSYVFIMSISVADKLLNKT